MASTGQTGTQSPQPVQAAPSMAAPRPSRTRIRTADCSQISAQRRQTMPCLSTQSLGLAIVARRRRRDMSGGGAFSLSPDAKGKTADRSVRRETGSGMVPHGQSCAQDLSIDSVVTGRTPLSPVAKHIGTLDRGFVAIDQWLTCRRSRESSKCLEPANKLSRRIRVCFKATIPSSAANCHNAESSTHQAFAADGADENRRWRSSRREGLHRVS